MVLPCNVTDDASIDAVFATIEKTWGELDFLVHAIAYADKDELKGQYLQTSRDNFLRSLDISCYSLTAISQRAVRSEEHTSELQSLMRISYAVFCLKKNKQYTMTMQN